MTPKAASVSWTARWEERSNLACVFVEFECLFVSCDSYQYKRMYIITCVFKLWECVLIYGGLTWMVMNRSWMGRAQTNGPWNAVIAIGLQHLPALRPTMTKPVCLSVDRHPWWRRRTDERARFGAHACCYACAAFVTPVLHNTVPAGRSGRVGWTSFFSSLERDSLSGRRLFKLKLQV